MFVLLPQSAADCQPLADVWPDGLRQIGINRNCLNHFAELDGEVPCGSKKALSVPGRAHRKLERGVIVESVPPAINARKIEIRS